MSVTTSNNSGWRRVVTGSSIYLGTSIVNKLLPFILLPILTRFLSPADYGILAIYATLTRFASPVIGMQLQINIARKFFKQKQDEVAKLIANILIILAVSTCLGIVSVSLYLVFFDGFSGIPARWLYSIPIVTFFAMINQFNLTIFRMQGKALTYGFFEISNIVINLVLVLLFVYVLRTGWEGRAAAPLIATVVFGVVGILYLIRTGFLTPNYDSAVIKETLKVSIPLIPHAIGMTIIFMGDRFFIDHFDGKEAVGLYAVGYSFGMVIQIITDSFNKAWAPWMYERLEQNSEIQKRKIVLFTYAYDFGILLTAIVFSFFASYLLELMTPAHFHGAKIFIVWIALSYAFEGMYKMRTHYLIYEGKTGFLALGTFFSGTVNLTANYFLIKKFGAIGAAWASLLSYCLIYIATWISASRVYPMPWFNFRKLSGNI